jgi:hypothetical protein
VTSARLLPPTVAVAAVVVAVVVAAVVVAVEAE